MTAYFILGCPRSGTSLVAGTLHRNGIRMGSYFTHPSKYQPRGYYEDLDIVNTNQEVLVLAGGNHLHVPNEAHLEEAAHRQSFRENVAKFFDAHDRYANWGLKDPRVLLLWRFYKPHLQSLDVRFIFTYRNPVSNARSIMDTNFLSSNEWLHAINTVLRFQRMTFSAACHMFNKPQLFVPFEDWWRKPERQQQALSAFVGRELDYRHFSEGLWRS